MKTLTTILLAAAMLLLPFQVTAQEVPPDKAQHNGSVFVGVVLGVLVVAVGTVVITGLKKMCKMLPKLPENTKTNVPPVLTNSQTRLIDGSTNNPQMITFQESQDIQTWNEALTVTFDDGMNATVSRGGQVLSTNVQCYLVPGTNGEAMLYYDLREFSLTDKPVAFFRLLSQ